MESQSEAFQEPTGIGAIGILALTLAMFLSLRVERRHAVLPLLATACYMPLGQALVIGGVHFPFFRVLLLLGLFRVVVRREYLGIVPNQIDRLFLVWMVASFIAGNLTRPSWEFFVRRAGVAYDAGLCYFFVRCVLRSPQELVECLRFMTFMVLPLAAFTVVEKLNGHNLFAFLGGVPWVTQIREGKLRCQGPFRHPILAGTFAATLLPLIIGLWWQGKEFRRWALLGIGSCIWIAGAASSSGALMAVMAAISGTIMWRIRHQMRYFRRGVVLAVVTAGMIMNAPVWYLIATLSEITGGTGWHRAYLIDQAVKHVDEWWLVGTAVTAHWAPAGQVLAIDPENMDITNHFIYEAINGGIVKLGLFVALIVAAFKILGAGARSDRLLAPEMKRLYWFLGVCLTCHCVSFISVAYFDQMIIFWYWLLAGVAMLASWLLAQKQRATQGL